MPCQGCAGADCLDNIANLPDVELYNLNEGQMFFNDEYCFVLNCPQGYICFGPYPRTLCIPPRVLPPIVFGPNGQVSVHCCLRTLFATVPANSNQSQLDAIVQGLYQQCALQAAMCRNRDTGPGIFPPPRPGPFRPPSNMQFIGAPGPACVGASYTATIGITGGNGAVITGIVSGSLPPGLFPGTGTDGHSFLLHGTPTQAGSFTFTLSATDLTGTTITKEFTVQIRGISNLASLPDGVENTAYSFQLEGAGGTPPYTFAIITGTLPAGLAMSSSGLISGTPDYVTAGDYPLSIQVNDTAGNSCIQDKTMHIALRPGPNWLLLNWDTYTLNQGGGLPNSASGSASGNVATGHIVYQSMINPFPGISPVHASIPGGYTGPAVTARIRLSVTFSGTPGVGVGGVQIVKRNAIQLGGSGLTNASGVFTFDVNIPLSVGATIEVDDGPGISWADLNQIAQSGEISFTWVIFNL